MLLDGLGLLQTIPPFSTLGAERGWRASFLKLVRVFAAGGPLHFVFRIQTKANYATQTVLVGGFVTRHTPMDKRYRFFASSNLHLGVELAALPSSTWAAPGPRGRRRSPSSPVHSGSIPSRSTGTWSRPTTSSSSPGCAGRPAGPSGGTRRMASTARCPWRPGSGSPGCPAARHRRGHRRVRPPRGRRRARPAEDRRVLRGRGRRRPLRLASSRRAGRRRRGGGR